MTVDAGDEGDAARWRGAALREDEIKSTEARKTLALVTRRGTTNSDAG